MLLRHAPDALWLRLTEEQVQPSRAAQSALVLRSLRLYGLSSKLLSVAPEQNPSWLSSVHR